MVGRGHENQRWRGEEWDQITVAVVGWGAAYFRAYQKTSAVAAALWRVREEKNAGGEGSLEKGAAEETDFAEGKVPKAEYGQTQGWEEPEKKFF